MLSYIDYLVKIGVVSEKAKKIEDKYSFLFNVNNKKIWPRCSALY